MSDEPKRGHAINGDLFTLTHPKLDLSNPFTSHVDVVYDGITHQLLTSADIGAFNFANVTGEFTVADLPGYIIESLDNVATQATHVYRAVVRSETGVLATQSYQSVEQVLGLVGAARPTPTRLGMVIDPYDTVSISSAPKVTIQLDIGIIEITPLTQEVIEELPEWSGTPVEAGEIYAGMFTDDAPYLTLVTPTCRVITMLGPDVDVDEAIETLGRLPVHWAA